MKHGERRKLRMQNMRRLRDLGLPTDLLSPDFWEREQAAKQRERLLLREFERYWRSGDWDHLSLPFGTIIKRWLAAIDDPMHFASIGPHPRWVLAMSRAGGEWRRERTGAYRKAWRDYRRKQIAKKRAAQGKPQSTYRV